MAMVNVNRKVTDQFYRYKMPKLIAKVEGKGNGIKTVIVNMVDIAKALYRPPAYPTKFFGCELGAQTQIDKKNDRFIVNGSHTGDKLQEILDTFIEKFVLCQECDNPETTFVVQPKKEMIRSVCTACGHQGLIDMRHRLATFILKNPPTDDSFTPQKLKKAREKQNQENTKEENGKSDESGFDGWSSDPIEAADDEWSEDTSEEAVKNRQKTLGEGIKGLVVNDDLEKTEKERFDIFFKFVKNKINADKNHLNDKEIFAEAERLDIKDRAPLALAELVLNHDLLTQIPKHRTLFLRFLVENVKAQKVFMGAFELLVGNDMDKLLVKVPHILKAFYDGDYVEEEVILEWGNKVSKKYVSKDVSQKIHDKAKPFLDWLKTADEESDEEEEDEEVEVVYTHRSAAVVAKEDAQKNKPQEEEDDDDLDIDDI